MKKIINIVLYVLMSAMLMLTALKILHSRGIDLIPKEKVYITRQYDLDLLKKQVIQNAKGAIDFYVKIHDGKQKRDLSAIYSFDLKSETDITSMQMYDDTTIILPLPTDIVDQADYNAPLITRQSGNFSFNDELQPIKSAMEKMAKHYSRTTFLEKSKEAFVDYASNVLPKYNYYFSGEISEVSTLTIPHCGARIVLFSDLCPSVGHYVVSDSTYTREGILFKSKKMTKACSKSVTGRNTTYPWTKKFRTFSLILMIITLQ